MDGRRSIELPVGRQRRLRRPLLGCAVLVGLSAVLTSPFAWWPQAAFVPSSTTLILEEGDLSVGAQRAVVAAVSAIRQADVILNATQRAVVCFAHSSGPVLATAGRNAVKAASFVGEKTAAGISVARNSTALAAWAESVVDGIKDVRPEAALAATSAAGKNTMLAASRLAADMRPMVIAAANKTALAISRVTEGRIRPGAASCAGIGAALAASKVAVGGIRRLGSKNGHSTRRASCFLVQAAAGGEKFVSAMKELGPALETARYACSSFMINAVDIAERVAKDARPVVQPMLRQTEVAVHALGHGAQELADSLGKAIVKHAGTIAKSAKLSAGVLRRVVAAKTRTI